VRAWGPRMERCKHQRDAAIERRPCCVVTLCICVSVRLCLPLVRGARRLFSQPSLQDLDAAFGAEVAAAFSSHLLQLVQAQQPGADEGAVAACQQQWRAHQQQLSRTAVWNVMMRVRVGAARAPWWPRQCWRCCGPAGARESRAAPPLARRWQLTGAVPMQPAQPPHLSPHPSPRPPPHPPPHLSPHFSPHLAPRFSPHLSPGA
jgi:hypothetical protein